MAESSFEIRTDATNGLLHIILRGHWSTSTVASYKQAVSAAVGQIIASGCVQGDIRALVDARGVGAQPSSVVEEYKRLFGSVNMRPFRLATIVSSSLFKMQVKRIAIPNQRIFTDEADATQWLLAPKTSALDELAG